MTAKPRGGFTLLELVLTGLLGALVVLLALKSVVVLQAAHASAVARADFIESIRITRSVLRREIGSGLAGRDWVLTGDTIVIRGFRGEALVCPGTPGDVDVDVSFRGERLPDPTKDSVLLVHPDGSTSVAGLLAARVGLHRCGGGPWQPATWTLDRALGAPVVYARVFERGSYHIGRAALRYRRGAGGRQPLTAEAFASSSRGLRGDSTGLGVLVEPRTGGPPWEMILRR